jgi:hypothetical protein
MDDDGLGVTNVVFFDDLDKSGVVEMGEVA